MTDLRAPSDTVLVLGGGGFIGARVAQALAETQSYRPILGLRRSSAPGPGLEGRVCDARDRSALARALDGVDVVVNCIGGAPPVMVEATRNVCAVARRAVPRRIVHVSSIAIYGSATGAITEATPLAAPASGYGLAKRACEAMIEEYVRDGGEAVILRPSCVQGPGSELWTSRMARLLRAHRIGDLGPAGDGTCNLIYIEDLAAAVIAAIALPDAHAEKFNLSDPAPLTWNEFLIRFGRLLGATPIPRIGSRRISLESKIVAPALRLARIVGGARVPDAITPSLVELWRQEIAFSPAKADELLRLPRTALDRALTASVRWLSEPSRQAHGRSPADNATDTGLARS